MTAKQKYLFDLNGYLHIKNALAADELSNAQVAIDRLLKMSSNKLPPGIGRGDEGDTSFSNGFSSDKSLETLTWHLVTRPIISKLTGGKLRFNRGSLSTHAIIKKLRAYTVLVKIAVGRHAATPSKIIISIVMTSSAFFISPMFIPATVE